MCIIGKTVRSVHLKSYLCVTNGQMLTGGVHFTVPQEHLVWSPLLLHTFQLYCVVVKAICDYSHKRILGLLRKKKGTSWT